MLPLRPQLTRLAHLFCLRLFVLHWLSLAPSRHLRSNAKAIWANSHPMNSEELITVQAESVYATGGPGA